MAVEAALQQIEEMEGTGHKASDASHLPHEQNKLLDYLTFKHDVWILAGVVSRT